MSKLYFKKDDINCYSLDYFRNFMEENKLSELTLYRAKKINITGIFYCTFFEEIGDRSEGGCGKSCESYNPKNGKSGACIHLGKPYEMTDETITIRTI